MGFVTAVFSAICRALPWAFGRASTRHWTKRPGLLRFDWDPNKAEANEAKHDVRFSEAATACRAPLSITIPDPEHSVEEARFMLVGLTYLGRLVAVAHAESHHSIRIISARLATKAERRAYEQ